MIPWYDDDRPAPPRAVPCHFSLGGLFFAMYGLNIESIESKKRKMPLLKELSRTSQDSFESESDSQESRDVRLNSPKCCIFHFCQFWANWADRPGILGIRFRFERILGRSALFPQKWRSDLFELFWISNRSNRSNRSNISNTERIPRCPKSFKRFERVWTGPNASANFEKLAKTSKNPKNFRKNLRNYR